MFTGADDIRRMFTDFFASWDAMVHDVTNLSSTMLSGERRRRTRDVAERRDGHADVQLNFFAINDDGRFDRVIIWMDGNNPLQ